MAGVFFWLYMSERKEHKETRQENKELMEARRVDAKETADNITEPLRGISQGIQALSDKIELGRRRSK